MGTPERAQAAGGEPAPPGGSDTEPCLEPSAEAAAGPIVLTSEVRARVLAFAAATLNGIPEPEVPASLRAIRRFTPTKQIRLGGPALALALESDEDFRDRVAGELAEREPDLVEALRERRTPPAAPLDDVAAVAYLIRAPGWASLLAQAQQEAASSASAAAADELDRLREQVAAARAAARDDTAVLRNELAEARTEADDLRRRLRSAESALGRAGTEANTARIEAQQQVAAAQETASLAVREAEAETRRLRARLVDAEAALNAARRAGREARDLDSIRLRVLLDTLLGATAGLKRELDLDVVVERPADTLIGTGDAGASGPGDPLAGIFAARGGSGAEPALVDAVLAVPGLHLLIDGYNVTKSGYPELSLEAQRVRLLRGLGGLVARHPGAELTCVFDGTAALSRPTAVHVPRGVRVLFSAVGELADELLVRLVRAEPPGRPLAVVTNDREIVTAVRAADARVLPSQALLARLERI